MALGQGFQGQTPMLAPYRLTGMEPPIRNTGRFSWVPRLPLLHDDGPLHPQIPVDATEVLEDPRRLEGQGKGAAGARVGPDGTRVEHLGRVEDASGPGRTEDGGIPDELRRTVS